VDRVKARIVAFLAGVNALVRLWIHVFVDVSHFGSFHFVCVYSPKDSPFEIVLAYG
jgi:hypothetical protein